MKFNRCSERQVDKRVIDCQIGESIERAVIEDGELKYTTYRDCLGVDFSDIEFHSLLNSVYTKDINKKMVDEILAYFLTIKFLLKK